MLHVILWQIIKCTFKMIYFAYTIWVISLKFADGRCAGRSDTCVAQIVYVTKDRRQATGLDAWASRVKCPARFLSHLHDICIWVVYSFCLVCCLFIIVTTQFVAWYKPCKPKPKPSTYDPPDNHPLAEIQRPMLRPEPKQQICHQHANTDHFGK